MAQGKLKVKAKKPSGAKGKRQQHQSGKAKGVTKKGRKVVAPKKDKARELLKLHKATEKGIRGNIEATLAQRAKQVEEGKAFNVVKTEEDKKRKGKK